MPYRPRPALWSLPLLLSALVVPASAAAQLAPIQGFLSRATDLSFYASRGGLLSHAGALTTRSGGLKQLGVELLFEAATVNRPVPGAPAPPADDTLQLQLSRVEINRDDGHVDSVYIYEAHHTPPPSPPMTRIWTVEVGVGYGQLNGFQLRNPALDMRGSVRDLPAASVYVTYEPLGIYVGLRTGYMQLRGLQVIERSTGRMLQGDADAFFSGVVAGYALEWGRTAFFMEPSFQARSFPSVKWSGDDDLRALVPLTMRLGGWTVAMGVQVRVKS